MTAVMNSPKAGSSHVTPSAASSHITPSTSRPDSPTSFDDDLDYTSQSKSHNTSFGTSVFGSLNSPPLKQETLQNKKPQFEFGKFYSKSYLNDSKYMNTSRRTLDNSTPNNQANKSFIKPENFSYERLTTDSMGRTKNKPRGGIASMFRAGGGSMSTAALRAQMRQPTPKSPRSASPSHMQNEEAIRMAAYPRGRPSSPQEQAPIERLDWPCPASPAALLPEILAERRKQGGDVDEEEEEPVQADPKLEKEIETMSKLSGSTLAKAILQDLEKKWERVKHIRRVLDPHKASRVPAANREPKSRLRYESAMFASPSRILGVRRRSCGEADVRRAHSTGGTLPTYTVPKPGYGLAPKSTRSLPGAGRHACLLNYSYESDTDNRMSELSTDEVFDRSAREGTYLSTMSDGRSDAAISDVSQGSFRFKMSLAYDHRSLGSIHGPPKVYPYQDIKITNSDLPKDVDKLHLEQHLGREEFVSVFSMSPEDFYRLPEWKQNDVKRKLLLF